MSLENSPGSERVRIIFKIIEKLSTRPIVAFKDTEVPNQEMIETEKIDRLLSDNGDDDDKKAQV